MKLAQKILVLRYGNKCSNRRCINYQYECDRQVQRVYKVMAHTDIKEKVAGRGGTLFSPVIEYVNNDKYFRDALLIYFTDGYGESEIPKPRTYRNMWVVIGDARHLSVKEPYGTVLSL